MKNLAKTPFTILMFSFFVASCLFSYCGLITKVICISLAVLLTASALILRYIKKKSGELSIIVRYACIGLIIAGGLSLYSFDFRVEKIERCAELEDIATVCITECDYSLSYEARYTAEIKESDMIPSGTIILLTSPQIGLDEGTLLRGELVYSSISEMSSSSFNAKNYYLPKGIMICAEDVSLEIIGEENIFSIRKFFSDINKSLTAKITAHSSAESGGLQAAVLLGNKDHLSDSTTRDFRRLGISHLLVVSGMHFAIIVSFIERALRRLRINRRYRAVINIVFTLFLMALMGFSPSVTRAGIMCIIAQFAQIISRRASQLNSLAFAGSLMIIINPYLAIDCGMQLSFIATYSCITFVQFRSYLILKRRSKSKHRIKSKKILRILRNIGETVLLTVFVNISMLPILCIYFGEISLMSIPANIIFIPAITILMYLSALYLLLYPFRIFIIPLSSIIDRYCDIVEEIASWMSSPNFSIISINYDWNVFFLIPICILVLILPYVSKKYIKHVGILLLVTLISFGTTIGIYSATEYDKVEIAYVSENKNDGIIVKSNGKIMLCDFSDASLGFSYEILEEVTELHSTEIEAILFTHYHSKHVQLFNRISDREIVRNIILTSPINETEAQIYDTLYKSALAKGILVYTLEAGENFSFGNAIITVFERKYISRSTHPITGMQIKAYGETLTYASGSFNQSTEEIMYSIENSDHVILGRHSPVYKKTYSIEFTEIPESAIICSDAYEYMNEETKEYLLQANIIIDSDKYKIIIDSKK